MPNIMTKRELKTRKKEVAKEITRLENELVIIDVLLKRRGV